MACESGGNGGRVVPIVLRSRGRFEVGEVGLGLEGDVIATCPHCGAALALKQGEAIPPHGWTRPDGTTAWCRRPTTRTRLPGVQVADVVEVAGGAGAM